MDTRSAHDNQSLPIADGSEAPQAMTTPENDDDDGVDWDAISTRHAGLAVCVFAHEKATTPVKNGRRTWEKIVALHEARDFRPGKSGYMFGGYALNGAR
jgi:hypothetical protein